ncbi:hypothetical protein [Umezawaea sp. Da 62-37]|uniref:hypothetical protein n=1 Tax=Umezawaea sp. Da 62-37 TaxID=3075927 RepID=UPI0028F721E5|nr:hypothetical protein [Umezawaea sp. Da 62-37]WNV85123.1 hypothetical protein RM788_44445 [Umezawaea sp. Da 62-37]
MTTATGTLTGPRALSCYTANLAAYLEHRDPGSLDTIARTVHLAVRTLPDDALAVSHHAEPLHRLPRDGELRHACTRSPMTLLRELDEELERHGRIVVFASSATLPWSIARSGRGAPHLLLVDGHDGERRHVVDEFSAQLPDGRQEPFAGWIDDDALIAVMRPDPAPPREHALRDEHAFGVPLPRPPVGTYRWLSLGAGGVPGESLSEHWRVGAESALTTLRDFWSELAEHPGRARFLDDMWAASQHHTFRYARLLRVEQPGDEDAAVFRTAASAWTDLPMALHFAARSAARGRARPAVVTTTFDHLIAAELAAQRLLDGYGYRSAP